MLSVNRRERDVRWDGHRFEALREFIAAGNAAIGALYDRGHSMALYGADSPLHNQRKQDSRVAFDRLRVAKSAAELTNPELRAELNRAFEPFLELKTFAEAPLLDDNEDWIRHRATTSGALNDLTTAASEILRIRRG